MSWPWRGADAVFDVRPLDLDDLDTLAALLVETVDGGGSVSFMAPLAMDDARGFWRRSLEAAVRGERVVLGAFADGQLASTVTLHLDCPPNQPHRGEIAKMMTATAHRGQGAASLVLGCAEQIAREAGRTLLVLDTASEDGASGLYERHGWTYAGEIPDYALKPHGGLVGTKLYYKRL
jgi:ribosomal protein S18 acetylase RimI-like enzyme